MRVSDADGQLAAVGNEVPMRRGWSRKRWAIATGIFVLWTLGGACVTRLAVYTSGTSNDPAVGYFAEMAFWPLLLVAAFVLVVGALFSLISRPRNRRDAGIRWALIAITLFVSVAGFMISQPAPSIFLAGVERWATENADIEAIQQWLIAEGANYSGQGYIPDFPPDFPKCLIELKPEQISFHTTPEGMITVELDWGRTLVGTWGLIVGPTTMSAPKVGPTKPGGRIVEVRPLAKPGAYVIDRG
jgi:hypothetical protein